MTPPPGPPPRTRSPASAPAPLRYELVAEAASETAGEPPLRIIRRALRGRWRAVAVAAAVLGILGAVVGFRARPVRYESHGLVLIEGQLSPILYESQETRVPPMFEAYIAAQMAHLHSRHVLDDAVASPSMREIGWPEGAAGVAALQRALSITRGRREHMVRVAVSDSDPHRARIAVNAVLAAFEQTAIGLPGLSVSTKEDALLRRQTALETRLGELQAEIMERSDQYGPETIARLHVNRIEELIAVDQKLAELHVQRAGDEPLGLAAGLAPGGLTPLEEQEVALLAERETLRARFGDQHPLIRALTQQIESLRTEQTLRERIIARRLAPPTSDGSLRANAMVAIEPTSAPSPETELESYYESRRELLRGEVKRLGDQRVALTRIEDEVGMVRQWQADTRRRLEEIHVETSEQNLSRISISAWGDLPLSPASDRRLALAGAGGVFGLLAGTALVVLVGLVDPRLRYLEELERCVESPPVVGLLPVVDPGDPTSIERSTRRVHQLRNVLELRETGGGRIVHAVTSAARGEGRTSLVLALGSSFAAAGRRTLVIDADVSRATLSRELGLAGRPGLHEALGAAGDAATVHRTRQEDLWAMPVGAGPDLGGEDLSRGRLDALLDVLRERFDAIVLDTGPVLGGVESCLIAALSDQVITVVRRCQRREHVRAALGRLEQVGAPCVGLVLNAASDEDACGRDLEHEQGHAAVASLMTTPAETGAAPAALAAMRDAQSNDDDGPAKEAA